jgi:anti-sigma B factor antagonist
MKTVELAPGVVCVELSGELDYARAYAFDREMQAVEEVAAVAVAIDLRSVSFIDSAGVARIIAARRRADRAGRRFAVVRGSKAVDRVLALTALDQQFEIVSDPRALVGDA